MRKIAVMEDFLTKAHMEKLRAAAERLGFAVDFYPKNVLPDEKAGEYEVIYGTVPPKELKAATALRWFCCAYAGMDQWKDDALYHSPEVMLSNSSGAYGVTISEHMVMVTLMLLRQMPTVQEWMHRHDWSDEKPPMRSVCGSRITVLGAGDTVVLLSDGITDADAVGLEALLCRFQSQDQQELADTVLAYAKAHTPADRRDDMSVIVARLLPN